MPIGKRIDYEKLRETFKYGDTRSLAKQLGIHRASLSRKLANPMSIDDLNEICFYLERDTEYFLVEYEMTAEEMGEKQERREQLKVKRKLGKTT